MTEFDEAAREACLEALSLLRQDKPVTLAELNDAETDNLIARKLRHAYDGARHEVLTARDWNFARQSARVASVETGGAWHAFRFTKPSDALKIVRVEGAIPDRELHYTLVGDGVFVDEPPRVCEYTQDVEDLALWPAMVRRAFVYGLARDLAIPITGRTADLKVMSELYAQKLKDAAKADARETHPDPWEEPYYVRAIKGSWNGRRRGKGNG